MAKTETFLRSAFAVIKSQSLTPSELRLLFQPNPPPRLSELSHQIADLLIAADPKVQEASEMMYLLQEALKKMSTNSPSRNI